MIILLDIDGVLVTEPSWKKVETGPDGFMLFNEWSARYLAEILLATNAAIVLTTTHRITFDINKWIEVLGARGLKITDVSKLNDVNSLALMDKRASEIEEWVSKNNTENYVIIDDDSSIEALPVNIKSRWVKTNPMVGIDEEAKHKALQILGVTK